MWSISCEAQKVLEPALYVVVRFKIVRLSRNQDPSLRGLASTFDSEVALKSAKDGSKRATRDELLVLALERRIGIWGCVERAHLSLSTLGASPRQPF